jgi:hypothetical protein
MECSRNCARRTQGQRRALGASICSREVDGGKPSMAEQGSDELGEGGGGSCGGNLLSP